MREDGQTSAIRPLRPGDVDAGETLIRPRSVTISWINWLGVAALLATFFACRHYGVTPLLTMVLAPAAFAAVVILLEAFVVPGEKRLAVPMGRGERVFTRSVGLLATFLGLLLIYWLFPYTREQLLFPFLAIVGMDRFLLGLLLLVSLTPAYLAFADHGPDASDGAHALGAVLLGRSYEASPDTLREHALGWGVKGFFLPLMISFMWADVNWLLQIDLAQAFANFSSSFEFLFRFTYLLDVTIAVAGYMLTFKLLGSHIRWSEPTAWGWLVCLACYPPFWPIIANNFAAYDDGFFWGNMLPEEGPLRTLWGCAILSLNFIYLWATIQFGIRFSNLTHRGILTNGPYRWVKHPAYLAKNASWWLISVPFMHEAGATEALRHCLLLLLVNAIYYWRAKTEEAHLARDPTYRAYQAWIAQHGLFAPLRRAIGWRR